MASTVHYKFKSQKDYDSVGFDGMFISVGDLKKSIVEKKGLARDQACELLLTGDLVDGQEAERIGLVNRSVPADRVLPTALELATKIAETARPSREITAVPYPRARTWTASPTATAPSSTTLT